MKNIIKNKVLPDERHGFTLIEILLYMIVASVVLFAIMDFAIQISIVNKKTTNMQEIVTNMDFISTKITSSIQSATSINNGNCIFDNDIGKLSLNVFTPTKSPTTFYLQDSMVYLQEGANNAIKINSDSMKCTKLKFEKISQT